MEAAARASVGQLSVRPCLWVFVLWVQFLPWISMRGCDAQAGDGEFQFDCSQASRRKFLANLFDVGTITPQSMKGLWFDLKNAGSELEDVSFTDGDRVAIVSNGTINEPVIAIMSTATIPEHQNSLTMGLYVESKVLRQDTYTSCLFHSCIYDANYLTAIEFHGVNGAFNVPVGPDKIVDVKMVVHCSNISNGKTTQLMVVLNCVKVGVDFGDYYVRFLVSKVCSYETSQSLSTGPSNTVVYAVVAVAIIAVMFIVLFIVKSRTCRFTGGPVADSRCQMTAVNGINGSTTTPAVTLLTASQTSPSEGDSHTHPAKATSVHSGDSRSRSYARDTISGMFVTAEHVHPPPFGSVSQTSDGADSNSFSNYERTSIGHIEWQSSDIIAEIKIKPDRLQLADVIRSAMSIQEFRATRILSDGDREPVLVKAFTKASSGPVVEKHILEALHLRRVALEKRRNAFQEIIGIIIPGGHDPPLLVYRFDAYDENLRQWLLRMKSNELSRNSGSHGYRGDGSEGITCHLLGSLGAQIARGCKYLSRCCVVHRDIAARNCILNIRTMGVKICDAIYSQELYPEGYMKHPSLPKVVVPLKWMAVEAFSEGLYTSSSDVWSFGVTLWEIFTLGRSPYGNISAEDLEHHLRVGNRLDAPQRCPNSIFTIIGTCWALSPHERWTFHRISQKMSEEVNREPYRAPRTLEVYGDLPDDFS